MKLVNADLLCPAIGKHAFLNAKGNTYCSIAELVHDNRYSVTMLLGQDAPGAHLAIVGGGCMMQSILEKC